MKHTDRFVRCLSLIAIILGGAAIHDSEGLAAEPTPLFNRDIRPILAEHCFACHGPDGNNRKSGLRLDTADGAMRPADSGQAAIVAGKPDESALLQRMLSTDPHDMMPPPTALKRPNSGQIALLRKWIENGASFEQHWAFIAPRRATLPTVRAIEWPRNEIDYFVLAKLEQESLAPSPEADESTLFRRITLDLIGLPLSESASQTTVSRGSSSSTNVDLDREYLARVDALLHSPQFGERMAVDWLDAARFADSNGYQVDRDREMYAWRDWVIQAFNSDMPYDQFTVEQIAGDLLPNATLAQRIATGFHRNHMMNEEGGIIAEEFLNEYCADRVESTATIWLGQTFQCARCHDHKYDPFTQRDFYGIYAFFHNVNEKGVGNYGANIRRNNPPMLKLPAPDIESQLVVLNQQLTASKDQLAQLDKSLADGMTDWEWNIRTSPDSIWYPLSATTATENSPVVLQGTIADSWWPSRRLTAIRLSVEQKAREAASPEQVRAEPFQFASIKFFVGPKSKEAVPIVAIESANALPSAEVAKALDAAGKTVATVDVSKSSQSLVLAFAKPLPLVRQSDGENRGGSDDAISVRVELDVRPKEFATVIAWRIEGTERPVDQIVPNSVADILVKEPTARTPQESSAVLDFRRSRNGEHKSLTDRIAGLNKQIDETDLKIPTTLVMEELAAPRVTNVLMRGAYDKKGDVVTPNTPAILPGMRADLPRNRLGFAQWLTDPANPLPARVTVNRIWQSFFGVGLVRTSEDFGVQGTPPTHPELLDWLAVDFVESGWDVKQLVRKIVTSSTYRQSSRRTRESLERDPENRWYARAPRFRLQAEFLRDQALMASGLLVDTIGGPSVKPYHPPGLYEQVVAGSSAGTYVVGKGPELYRRSLYTYWKRSVPNPALLAFDMPFRETCTVRRSRTNTPLQALNLMNDPTYVEASRVLAERLMRERTDSVESQIELAFRLTVGRNPSIAEITLLRRSYESALADFRSNPTAASEFVKVGDTTISSDLDLPRLAALATIANTILNLDEVVMRE